VDRGGRLVGKYRKVHLPGHARHEPWRPFQHLEKRYFDVGNLGFPVWRHWAACSACASATIADGPRRTA
jgi:predicted amidohydrolase